MKVESFDELKAFIHGYSECSSRLLELCRETESRRQGEDNPIDKAIANEREACANLMLGHVPVLPQRFTGSQRDTYAVGYQAGLSDMTNAIRARSTQPASPTTAPSHAES